MSSRPRRPERHVEPGAATRLLVVSHTYVEPANRAKWRALHEMEPAWDITIVTPRRWRDPHFGELISPEEDRGRLRCLPLQATRGGAGRYVFVAPALIGVVKRARPDVIWVEAEPWSAVYLQLALVRRLMCPSAALAVFSWWNTPQWTSPLRFPGNYAYRVGLRAADLLVAGNHDAANLHARHGYAGRVIVLPQLGVDLRTHAPGPPDPSLVARYGLAGEFVIGFAGRLTAQKGVDVLLRAVPSLSGNWRVLIVGRGPEEGRLRALAQELRISDRVVFAGAVTRGDMPAHLRLLHVLVLPSLEAQWEQFGYVLVEAMACGIPVVGSTSGEIRRVIGDESLVFPMGEASALRERLARVMQDAAHAGACRARGLDRARRLFGNQAIAARIRWAVNDLSRPGDVVRRGEPAERAAL